jgi:tRNA(adenine34) deaminase
MNSDGEHEGFMRQALRQAVLAAEDGEVPAGCVIVNRAARGEWAAGAVIGRAHNQTERLKDPTAHAEMIAITQAAGALRDWRLTDTVLYVTKEPCAMCAGAIVLARIPTVVFGVPDPKRGGAVSVFTILNHPALNHRCEVVSGVLADECRALLQDFFRERRGE